MTVASSYSAVAAVVEGRTAQDRRYIAGGIGLDESASRMAVALAKRADEAADSEDELDGGASEAGMNTPRALAVQAIEDAMAPADEDDAALLAAYEALGVAATERQAS